MDLVGINYDGGSKAIDARQNDFEVKICKKVSKSNLAQAKKTLNKAQLSVKLRVDY